MTRYTWAGVADRVAAVYAEMLDAADARAPAPADLLAAPAGG